MTAAQRTKGLAIITLVGVTIVTAALLAPGASGSKPVPAATAGQAAAQGGEEFRSLAPPYATDHVRRMLRPGLTQSEMQRLLGNGYIQVTLSDAGSEQLAWRYDIGPAPGLQVATRKEASDWAHTEAILAGELYSQLMILWEGDKAARMSLAYRGPNGKLRYEALESRDWQQYSPAGSKLANPPASLQEDKDAQLLMLDERNGWAVGSRLWVTQDGGRSWEDRSPSFYNPDTDYLALPLTGKLAYGITRPKLNEDATDSNEPSDYRIFRTDNGGHAWSTHPLPLKGLWNTPSVHTMMHLDFSDAAHGIVFLASEPGYRKGPIQTLLLRTDDGGQTWQPNGSLESSGIAIEYSTPSGLNLTSPTEGWLSFANNPEGKPELYRTQDGGTRWKRIELPLPSQQSLDLHYQLESGPHFYGPANQEGVLSLSYSKGDHSEAGALWLQTRDGGDTWVPMEAVDGSGPLETADPPGPAMQGPRLHFSADLDHAWMVNPSLGELYATNDGGRHWELLQSSPLLQTARLAFHSPTKGWMTGTGFLYQTDDGGKTWAEVNLK